MVVAGKVDRNSRNAVGQNIFGAIVALICQDYLFAIGVAPQAIVGHGRNRRSRIDANMQESHTGIVERSDNAARMPRHIGHLCRNGVLAVGFV